MALDTSRTDRDYLFGRLLAVYEAIESRAQYLSGTNRTPNALKEWSSYIQTPARTATRLEEKTLPYLEKLNAGSKAFYAGLKGDIFDALNEAGFTNHPLQEGYLVGYYAQRAELRKKKEDTDDNNNETIENN